MKKILNYQRFIIKFANPESNASGISILLIIVLAGIAAEFSVLQWGYFNIANAAVLVCGLMVLTKHRKMELRSIPVSDSFVLKNLLFYLPVRLCIIMIIAIVIIFCTLTVTLFALNDLSFAMMRVALPEFPQFMSGTVYGILLLVGFYALIWFAGAIFFLKARKGYICVGYSIIATLFLEGNTELRSYLYSNSSKKKYYIYELMSSLPMPWVILIVIWAAVVILAFIDWKIGLKIYRKSSNYGVVSNNMEPTRLRSTKSTITALLIGVSVLIAFIVIIIKLFDSDMDSEINYSSDKISQYSDWDTWKDRSDMDAEYWCRMNRIIFPKEIKADNVNSYYAAAKGEYGDNSTNCYWYRYLSVTFDKNTYEAERSRLDKLNLSYQGETLHLLHDAEHFDDEAYIAEYSVHDDIYEYAILDNETYTIQYLYMNGKTPDKTPAGADCLPLNSAFSLIDANDINSDNDSFSVYEILK